MSEAITADELQRRIAKGEDVRLVDVRRQADYDQGPAGIPGATWLDPERIKAWAPTLSKDKPCVVYCVKGGAISQAAQKELAGLGMDVRFLEGGLKAWQEKP